MNTQKIYIVALRKLGGDRDRKNFFKKDDALEYWERMGKVEYTYWEEFIY